MIATLDSLPPSITKTLSTLRIVLSQWTTAKLGSLAINLSNASWIWISVRVSTLLVASCKIRKPGSAGMARAMVSNWR